MSYRVYASHLQKFFRGKNKVFAVADASDGSAGPILKVLNFKNLKVRILNGNPDGDFPAHGPDPMRAGSDKALSRETKKLKADFGAIFDGDGDRIFFVDDLGRRVSADAAALLISKNFRPPFVLTPVSGWTLKNSLKKSGIKWSRVGHYFIKRKMKKEGAKFAAEPSGHYYFEFAFGARKAHYDSALRAFAEFATRVSEIKRGGRKLSDWLDSLPQYVSSGELNFRAKDSRAVVAKIKKLYGKIGKASELDGLSVEGGDFWFNLRPSNTEPLLRLNAEAKSGTALRALIARVRELVYRAK